MRWFLNNGKQVRLEGVIKIEMDIKMETKKSEMRKAWFDFVKKTRVKMGRAEKRAVSHREAMKMASVDMFIRRPPLVSKVSKTRGGFLITSSRDQVRSDLKQL